MLLFGTNYAQDQMFQVADFFLQFFNKKGQIITNKKLQKLVYYSEAWSLALYNKNLFKDNFEAWVYGPVIPKLYHYFKSYSYHNITPLKYYNENLFSKNENNLLEEIANKYGKLDADQLVLLSHSETPWLKARGEINGHTPCDNIISKDEMKLYYKSLLN